MDLGFVEIGGNVDHYLISPSVVRSISLGSGSTVAFNALQMTLLIAMELTL
jgi:hypothetical protein